MTASENRLARLVGGIVEASPVPVSVKLRLSTAGKNDVNYLEHVEALRALGDNARPTARESRSKREGV